MTTTQQREAAKAAHAALAAFRDLPGIEDVFRQLEAAQRTTEAAGIWDTEVGRETEAAMGYLRMALEAAGSRIRF